MTSIITRRLYGHPELLQDWDEEPVTDTPQYWELFADLVLVAAASSIADSFQGSPSWHGFWEFAVLYFILVHGWSLYTSHYNGRFWNNTMVHVAVLMFGYLLGMAASIVNASLEQAQAFSWGILLQRGSFILMMIQVAIALPRARWFAGMISTGVVVSMLLFVATAWIHGENSNSGTTAAITSTTMAEDAEDSDHETTINSGEGPSSEQEQFTLVCWTVAAIVDFFLVPWIMWTTTKQQLVPVNIEHSKERTGVLVR